MDEWMNDEWTERGMDGWISILTLLYNYHYNTLNYAGHDSDNQC